MRRQTRTSGRTARRIAVSLVSISSFATVMTACAGATDPTAPTAAASVTAVMSQAKEFTAPAEYALWWKMTEACSGLTRNMSEIHFYADPNAALSVDPSSADSVVGQWVAATNSIVLVQSEVGNPVVVRHEMLHALLRAGGHPRQSFVEDCGGYVNCEAACARAAGPTPTVPASAQWIEPEALRLSQVVYSNTQLTAQGDGRLALVVEVRNPYAYPVWVKLKSFPGRPDVSATFGYIIESGSHQSMVDGDAVSFLPNEVKRTVFDLTAKDVMAADGASKIRGFFNAETLPEQAISFSN